MLQVSVRPGISAFAHNISALEPYMKDLLGQALDKLGALREQWYLIPVYLKATAGARNLYEDQRDAIFAKLRDILASCPFRFDDFYWARTISGEEEAVYAWLTVNAIQGTYRQGPATTWGALDMGGASTQIAFIPKGISIIQNYYPLHISSVHIHLYSHSYLEFGYRDAQQRLMRGLMHWGYGNGTRRRPILNPCARAHSIFRVNFSEAFALGRARYWVEGTGNVSECMRMATQLLNPNARCYVPAKSREFAVDSRMGACAIAGVYEPELEERQFIAMGQYAEEAAKLGLPLDRPVPMADWMAAVRTQCTSESWPRHCWRGIWLGMVITQGLRFPLDTSQIVFSKTLEGQQTVWALGAMMNEVNYYPWQSRNSLALTLASEGAQIPVPRTGATSVVGLLALTALASSSITWAMSRRFYTSSRRIGCFGGHLLG